jgi:hypothetical protein
MILQNSQQFHLIRPFQISNLVQENSTRVCQFEPSFPIVSGIGESAAFVAEELAFE